MCIRDSLKSAVYTVYGREGATGVLPVAFENSGIRISGYVGLPSLARGNRARETFIVNGRYVRDAILTNAVETAYDTRLMINRFPFFVLCIAVEPEEVDVNVHPNKPVSYTHLDVYKRQKSHRQTPIPWGEKELTMLFNHNV